MVEVTALEVRRFRMGTPAMLFLAGDHEQGTNIETSLERSLI